MKKVIILLIKLGVLKLDSKRIDTAKKSNNIQLLLFGLQSTDYKTRIDSIKALSLFLNDDQLIFKEIKKMTEDKLSIVALEAYHSLKKSGLDKYIENFDFQMKKKQDELISSKTLFQNLTTFNYPDFGKTKFSLQEKFKNQQSMSKSGYGY